MSVPLRSEVSERSRGLAGMQRDKAYGDESNCEAAWRRVTFKGTHVNQSKRGKGWTPRTEQVVGARKEEPDRSVPKVSVSKVLKENSMADG